MSVDTGGDALPHHSEKSILALSMFSTVLGIASVLTLSHFVVAWGLGIAAVTFGLVSRRFLRANDQVPGTRWSLGAVILGGVSALKTTPIVLLQIVAFFTALRING